MYIENLGPNQTQIETKDHKVILVSYSTPVAAFVKGKCYAVDYESTLDNGKRVRSKTTSRHINAFLEGNIPMLMPIEFFQELL